MQLDFDLRSGPLPKGECILTVSAVTRKVRDLLEAQLSDVWVEGEVSNLRRQSSGHVYFTLKDAGSQLACVMFAGQAAQLRGLRFEDGVQVQVFGSLGVYEPRGQYQLIARKVRAVGAGALQAKFEELKARLAAEGLFDAARKRPLPKFPARIGVVTSPTGAAIRDFLHVLHRRQKGVQVVIHPVRVQGRGAAAEIAAAISELSGGIAGPVDVIVVTRGGGSLEDLWEFNEEAVARAIVASAVPVVSAVGHEIDFTISDFAADVRAPTPSAAAEILSADAADLLGRLAQFRDRLAHLAGREVAAWRTALDSLARTALFSEPARVLRERRITLDRSEADLRGALEGVVSERRRFLESASADLFRQNPARHVADSLARFQLARQRMEFLARAAITAGRSHSDRLAALLGALDPLGALARGYTLTTDADGRPVSSARSLQAGDKLRTRFADGTVASRVEAD